MDLQSFVYYTNRGALEPIGSIEQAEAFFFDRRESWAIMGRAQWEAIHARQADTCIATSHALSVFDARFSDILNRRPPIEVLLVKNNCQ